MSERMAGRRHGALLAAIDEVATGFDGCIALAARELTGGASVAYHADRKCPTASVIKLPILVHVLLLAREGLLGLDEPLTLRDADKVPGSGILTRLTAGLTLSVRDACTLMVALSDNTATNLLIDRVGVHPVNERMRALGLAETTLHRKVFSQGPPVSASNRRYGLGVTTPREMMRLLRLLHEDRVGDAATCALARKILGTQQATDGIPRMLPRGCAFEGKGGAVDAVRNDVGIVTLPNGRAVAMGIFCSRMPAPLWTADNPGLLVIARLARMVVDGLARADEVPA